MRPGWLIAMVAIALIAVIVYEGPGLDRASERPESTGTAREAGAEDGGSPTDADDEPFAEPVVDPRPLPEGSPVLVGSRDCSSLLALLNERAIVESDALIDASLANEFSERPPRTDQEWEEDGFTILGPDEFVPTPGGGPRGPFHSSPVESPADAEVIGTDNHEPGVEEADVFKADGDWMYVLRGDRVFVFRAFSLIREIALAGEVHDGNLLLETRGNDDPENDHLIVITRTWSTPDRWATKSTSTGEHFTFLPRADPVTHVQVFSLGELSAPRLVDELWVDGENVGARLQEGVLHLVVNAPPPALGLRTWLVSEAKGWQPYNESWGDLAEAYREANRATVVNLTLADHLPSVMVAAAGGDRAQVPFSAGDCRRTLTTQNGTGRGVATIVSRKIVEGAQEWRVVRFVGGEPVVYESPGTLVLAASSRDAWWLRERPGVAESTDLHMFSVAAQGVAHVASGRVAGIVPDSFSIDLHDQALRVATGMGMIRRDSSGEWPVVRHVATLEQEGDALLRTAIVSVPPAGALHWTTRFEDSDVYLASFEDREPVWHVDLARAGAPRVVGRADFDGSLSFLVAASDDRLIALGRPWDAERRGFNESRISVVLFDTSVAPRARAIDTIEIIPDGYWTWPLHTEHYPFAYEAGTLVIPVEAERWCREAKPSGPHVGLRLVVVNETSGLRLRGEVHQDILCRGATQGPNVVAERVFFVNDEGGTGTEIWMLSKVGITVHDLSTGELKASVAFPS